MRLARLRDHSTALVIGPPDSAVVLDVGASLSAFARRRPKSARLIAEALPDGARGAWTQMVDEWPVVGAALRDMEDWGVHDKAAVAYPLEATRLRPPLCAGDVGIFLIGANFAQHAARATAQALGNHRVAASEVAAREQALIDGKAAGTPPWGFTILPRSVVGHDDIVAPPPAVELLDYEGEVAIVLRANAAGVAPWGVMAWNDLSHRGKYFGLGPRVDEGPLVWSLQKNFDCANACGPWLVVDPDIDVNALRVRTRVNGAIRQDGGTAEMVYSYAEVIGHLSAFVTLRSGDVISSGTPAGTAVEKGPSGPYLQDGDVVEVEVEGVGVLRNTIRLHQRVT